MNNGITSHQGNMIQSHQELSPHSCQNDYYLRQRATQKMMTELWKR